MKLLMLINPSSRGGRGVRLLPRYRSELDKRKIDRTEIILSSIDEAFERAKNLDSTLYDAAVAVGGDGTIRAVGAGLLANPDPALKLGVLYTGTSPDFCRTHNIPLVPDKAITCLAEGFTRQIPVLTANGNPFFCSCNPGMGAEVASRANKLRPFLGDFAGTLTALAGALLKNRRYTFKVNGTLLDDCNHLLITRMPFIASGLKLALPELKEEEYLLWYLQDVSRFKWLQILLKLYRKHPCGSYKIVTGPLIVETPSHGDLPLEYDGDPHGTLPLEIKFAPRRLDLIVPAGEK